MDSKKKKRFIVSGGIIAIVMIVLLAVLGSSGAAKTVFVAEAASAPADGTRIQVSGNVVDDSFEFTEDSLTFSLEDPENPGDVLAVSYDKGVSATFGNGVTAICTGIIDESGVLQCSELVTKCPSKYETSTEALSVSGLLDYGEAIYSKTVKVVGTLQAGTLVGPQEEIRFTLDDTENGVSMPVPFAGAIPDEVADGTSLVLTGSLGSDGIFAATDVAIEG